MSVELNTKHQPERSRKEIQQHLDEMYSKRASIEDADIFREENIIALDDIIRLTTGKTIGSFSALKHSYDARARSIAETERLADLLEAGGIQARIDDGNQLCLKTHVTGQIIKIPKYRNTNFLPSVAQRNRRDMMKDFEYFMTTDERMKNARYFVITAGPRVPFDNKKGSLKLPMEAFKSDLLQRWRNEICKKLGVEVLFQGIEFARNKEATYHIHANVVIFPPQHMLDDTSPAYTEFYTKTQDFFGSHFEDCGKIKSLQDFVRYTPSPEEAEFSGLTAGAGAIQLCP